MGWFRGYPAEVTYDFAEKSFAETSAFVATVTLSEAPPFYVLGELSSAAGQIQRLDPTTVRIVIPAEMTAKARAGFLYHDLVEILAGGQRLHTGLKAEVPIGEPLTRGATG